MRAFLLFVLLETVLFSEAQNLFPRKMDNCITERFCLDCGDTKADVDVQKMNSLVERLSRGNNLRRLNGKILFQVLVDSAGNGCVLSHTDVSNLPLSRNITSALNKFDGFMPAISNARPEPRTSFNISFEVRDAKMIAKVERVDMEAFKKSFDRPTPPEIFNKNYVYKNENLYSYTMTVWNSRNSNLPSNTNDHLCIDRNGIIWLTVDEGLVKFDGNSFYNAEQNITDKGEYFAYYALACDNDNIKWVYGKNNIYSYDDKIWKIYDSAQIGINDAYNIINNPGTSELFFCSNEGLTIYKKGEWSNLNKDKIKEMPSNRVLYAKRDTRNRIWMGTFSGSLMIDSDGKAICFENTNTVLKGKCITSMDEDDEGNVYFSLYEFDRKVKGEVNNDEGIAVFYNNETIKQFTTSNSGMPFNHANCVLFDKNEKVLWISTDRAGLVRFDLKNGWENYHSENSPVPTSYIATMAFDNKGVLYLATRQGLVRVKKK